MTQIVILFLAVTVHEVCHGWAALRLGDDTAYLSGRLTLNPIAHIDPVGTLLLPAVLGFATHGAIVFGWAKPVPVNPQRFTRRVTMRTGMSIVAAAGPLSNIALAFGFAGFYHLCMNVASPYAASFMVLAMIAVVTNLYLAFFNIIPIPPLDGSKVLLHFLHPDTAHALLRLEPYGFVIVILLFQVQAISGTLAGLTRAAAEFLLGY